MRVALYAKVGFLEKKRMTEEQLNQLRHFAHSLGWVVTAEFVDRPQRRKVASQLAPIEEMFEAAERGEFDVLVFWSLGRLTKETTFRTIELLKRLNDYGVHYRSATECYLDSTRIPNDAILGILTAAANHEYVRSRPLSLDASTRSRKIGRARGRLRVEEMAENLPRIRVLKRLWDEGKSIRQIAANTNFSVATVRRLVKICLQDTF